MGEGSKTNPGANSDPEPDAMGPSVLKFLISDRQAGRLIGKHGVTVGQISANCHVGIRVSGSNMFFPSTSDRIVLIGGEPSNIESAFRSVQEKVANPLAETQSLTMLVHSSLLPSFAGTNGAALQRISTEFNVSIHLGPKVEGANERAVSVTHRNSPQVLTAAVLALSSRVMSEPATVSNIQTNYDTPSSRSASPVLDSAWWVSGLVIEPEGSSGSTPPPGSDEEAHLAAASLLPFEEIKVDVDLFKGKRTTEADELICKICHTYFLGCAPKLTKCMHVFCGDCLESWIQVQPTFRSWAQVAKTAGQARLVPCPVCKTPLNDKTDIHLVLGEGSSLVEPDCLRVAASLRNLPVICHNNASEGGKCAWEGTYTQYQNHAKTCTLNASRSLIEPNTIAPPQSHQKQATCERGDSTVPVLIPFANGGLKDTVSVETGHRISILERAESSGWMYVRNLSAGNEGWIPEYCTKRYDAWFEDLTASLGKHVEKSSAIRDFDPTQDPAVANHTKDFQFMSLREGEVFTVCERSKNGWNLVINTDGSRQGWVPDNRCKVIREGSDHAAVAELPTQNNLILKSYVVRRSFEGNEKNGELALSQGETVSVRQANDSGWTFGVVVAGGSKKEGWFPDWAIERSAIEKSSPCVSCNLKSKNLLTFVRTSGPQLGRPLDLYAPICSEDCWELWKSKRSKHRR